MSNYGHQTSVLEAINDLQLALEMNYMRSGLSIHLEPDAFYRLGNELLSKDSMTQIPATAYDTFTLNVNGPSGPITIIKDDSLGINGYTKT